jgi:hypothetical protein
LADKDCMSRSFAPADSRRGQALLPTAHLVIARPRTIAVLAYVNRAVRFYREADMTVYMVERDLKGITMDELAAAQRRAIDTSSDFSTRGKPVRYIRTTFVPGEERSMCLFEASDPDLVREVNDEAKIPYTRVIEALDLTP